MILPLYAVLCVLNLVAGATDTTWLVWVTKPLLLPLLAFWVWRKAPAEKGIIAALLFCAAGDIALLPDGELWFMLGMALFLGAHLCYITTFWRHGARPKPLAVLGYGAVLVGGLAWLWSGLGALAIPMSFYGLALASTAILSASFGWRVGLGGALFMLSDLLLAVEIADAAQLPGPAIWVMLTYVLAQVLLATGWVRYRQRRD
ncbi:lysoplasmalogenase [Rhizocola hellebori]|uniref:Lysoplasmalogenase n=1 Tax=Rhizocola hellebori TaxID=1392758 RepID=A0A8J3Q746_9ACTN|nr:lysoplasmalogenase [Rhizocola hellebori]GIH05055.1 lysoplasmalogenase [Rhizocola hellebori]